MNSRTSYEVFYSVRYSKLGLLSFPPSPSNPLLPQCRPIRQHGPCRSAHFKNRLNEFRSARPSTWTTRSSTLSRNNKDPGDFGERSRVEYRSIITGNSV